MKQTVKIGIAIAIIVIGLIVVGLLVLVGLSTSSRKYTSGVSSSSGMGIPRLTENFSDETLAVGLDTMSAPILKRDSYAPMPSEILIENNESAIERLIIKTGELSVVVKDVAGTVKLISDYAQNNDGFVVSSQSYKIENAPYARITIRIPTEKFDQGFADMQTYGDVESETVNGQDVTEEYVDLDAQLRILKATEERLLDILNKAEEILDILEVEQQLKINRNELERIEGRMKYLRQNADLSTVTVNLSTDPSVLPTLDETDKWRPIGIIKEAARTMLDALKGIVNIIIWLVIFIPVWGVIILIIWGIIKILKRQQK